MAAQYVQQNAVGLTMTLTVKDEEGNALNLTGATTTEIRLKPPQGYPITKSASVVQPATSGKVRYVTEAGVLGVPGKWRAQAFVAVGGNEYFSTTIEFTVGANL